MGTKRLSTYSQHILALDASSSRASVALFSNEVWYEESIESTALQAQSLLPIIEHLLTQANLLPKHLDAIAFGRGPGSFTGLRIACSIAKGLAYAHNIPLYPISDLLLIARQAFQKETAQTPVLAMIDARMNQLYWAYFSGAQVVAPQEFVTAAEDINLPFDEPFVLAGVGFEAYETQMPERLLAQAYARYELYPSARELIAVLKTTQLAPVDVDIAAPVYVRNDVTHGEVRG